MTVQTKKAVVQAVENASIMCGSVVIDACGRVLINFSDACGHFMGMFLKCVGI